MSTTNKKSTSHLSSLTSTLTSFIPTRLSSLAINQLESLSLDFIGKQVKVGTLRIVGLDGVVRIFGQGEDSQGETYKNENANEKQNEREDRHHQVGNKGIPLPSPPYTNKFSSSSSNSTTNSGSVTPSKPISSPSDNTTTNLLLLGHQSHPSTGPRISIKILSPLFYARLLVSGDLGFAESYMAGEFRLSYEGLGSESKEEKEDGQGKEWLGQRLDEGYYGKEVVGTKSESGCREGEGLLDLFKIIIHSSHPSSPSSLSSINSSPSPAFLGLTTLPSKILSSLGGYFRDSRVVNSVRNSVGNIRAHYDISNRMFGSFLSGEMTYSCAIFPSLDSDLIPLPSSTSSTTTSSPNLTDLSQWNRTSTSNSNSDSTSSSSLPSDARNKSIQYPNLASGQDPLEQAQLTKIRHIIKKAGIRKGMKVLEIGSGWGSFAMEAVRSTGCTVDTITLSSQQKILAEARIAEAGLTSSITVHLVDFRSLPKEWAHTFDRLVSIEMLEAVGKEYIEPYFKMIDEVLNERGVACFQVITIPDARFEVYSKTDDFIRKWIFPGGFLPSVSFTTACIDKGSQGRLNVDSIVNIGPHYARTLREWRIRFLINFERDIRPALKDEHPEMTEEDIMVFKRKWIYYFVYCEIGFAERIIGDHIFTLSREGNTSYGCNVYE